MPRLRLRQKCRSIYADLSAIWGLKPHRPFLVKKDVVAKLLLRCFVAAALTLLLGGSVATDSANGTGLANR